MSDTHIENAILQAIDIIANKKVSQANFDKTIKAVVKERKDKTTGQYLIKYQDSEFTAYATSSDISYEDGTQVYVLIPGNDWDRVKTIIGNTKQQATVYKEVPASEQLYNRIGPNAISASDKFELCSYHQPIPNEQEAYVLQLDMSNEEIQRVKKYIRQGDGLAIGMSVRTAFDSGQIGGWYGLIFNLKFIDAEGHAATRPYIVSSKDVIGNPYALTKQTYIECLIKDINTEQFDGIQDIIPFVDGFPNTDLTITRPDIFINGIYMYGAQILTQEQLNGYTVNIDYTTSGNIIEQPDEEIKLIAQLKVNGKVITDNVDYYWCKENGLVFRGNPRYLGRAGDGWECLNNYFNTTPVPYKTGEFSIYHQGVMPQQTQAAAEVYDRINNLRCVVVYDNNTFVGDCRIIDMNSIQVSIDSSDKIGEQNKTIYYLDNGSPTLSCIFDKDNNKNYRYTWSVYPLHGKGYQIEQQSGLQSLYKQQKQELDNLIKEINKVEESKKEDFKREHDYYNKVNNLNIIVQNIKDQNQGYYRAFEDVLYDFPIESITGSSRITCVVEEYNIGEDENQYWSYVGTGSITLENRKELEGQYSLTLENGIQVFQYDNKGNSPLSNHLDKALQIEPLGFTLVDNEGLIIPYEQIINNGYVKWLVPKENSLLICNETAITPITGEDRKFVSLGFNIYNNLETLKYTIANQYDRNKDFNYIRLNVKYKDMIFDAYTEFTFPKDGDPGTNGTDFVAKIVPLDEEGKELNSDRLYVSNQLNGQMFDDQGRKIDHLKAKIYNNSRLIEDQVPDLWTCPPKGVDQDKSRGNTYLNVTFSNQKVTGKLSLNLDSNNWETELKKDLPIDIIRVMYNIGKTQQNNNLGFKCYAEIPVCYSYIFNVDKYRLKIVPKTGFKYVVYSSDGTSPNYDNTQPFEIKVQKYENGYFIDRTEEGYTFTWSVIGNLEEPEINNLKNCTIKPKNIFDGSDLFSAIVCEVKLNDITSIGFLHIPIYMILNRYGHQALNNWDGNSIQLNANGDTILAPQIGAGKKEDDNSFTGVLMGEIKESDDNKVGLVGYHQGERSIFLDAQTGKAQFGKQNAGKIILDPSVENRINGKDLALIYSGNYPIEQFKSMDNPNVKTIGNSHRADGQGMIIDLSTPQIGFGNGNFTVNEKGELTARGGGQIAGWSITDSKLHKDNKVGMASKDEAVPVKTASLKNGDLDTVAFWAGGSLNTNNKLDTANFYATHNGYLYSKLGQIAQWNFDTTRFYNGSVGMSSVNNNQSKYPVTVNNKTQYKAFFANGDNFYVTHNGYLRSTSGKIASWDIDSNSLTNGNVGMGTKNINSSRFNTPSNISAKFWAGSSNGNENFAVTAAGDLYSRSGKIAGWSIKENSLSTKGITINSNGSISGGNWKNKNSSTGWGITSEGNAYFNNGKIGDVEITSQGIKGSKWHIFNNEAKIPGLKVESDGSVSYTIKNYGSGVSGNGMHVAGGSSPSSVNMGTVQDSGNNNKTMVQTVNEIVTTSLFSGTTKTQNLAVYANLNLGNEEARNRQVTGRGNAIFTVASGKVKVNDGNQFIVGSGGAYIDGGLYLGPNKYKGETGKMIFSDKSWMKFQYGCLVDHKIMSTSQ